MASVAARSCCAALGTSTFSTRRWMSGAVAMKMMRTTRMMSTNGVTLIEVIGPSPASSEPAMSLPRGRTRRAQAREDEAAQGLRAREQLAHLLREIVVADDAGDG